MMDAARWQLLQSTFLAAMDLPAEARDAFVRSRLTEPDAIDDVLAMLDATTRGQGLRVDQRLLGDGGSEQRVVTSPTGAYQLLDRIGRGGMGDVYRARRVDGPLARDVAMKLLRASTLDDVSIARFRAEQQFLASLSHPGIVSLIDAGITDAGQPFLVMPVVDGEAITTWCDERMLPVRERLALFGDVCSAVQYAHRNLVVHRDLKPSNVWVTDDGNVQLLDFGIAKFVSPGGENAAMTRTADVRLTPEYAAPEQIRGEVPTTAIDVYGLGLVLYELLSGGRPFEVAGRSRFDLERTICEAPPAALTSRVDADAAERRGTTPRELHRLVSGDLETIVATALQKEPDRRYASPRELARDLELWTAGRPIVARPDTLRYRAGLFVRRNRFASGAAVAIALLVTVSAVMFSLQSSRIADERDRLAGVVDVLTRSFGESNPITHPGADTLSIAEFLHGNEDEILAAVQSVPSLHAELAETFGVLHREREEWEAAEVLLREAVASRREAGGPDDAHTLGTLLELARLRRQLDGDDAPALFREAIDGLRRAADAPPMVLARALSEYSALATSWTERRTLLAESVEIRSRECGENRICHAMGHNDLAIACVERDSMHAAADHFGRALDHLESTLSTDHPHVLAVRQNLATAFTSIGETARAESLLVGVLDIRAERSGGRTTRVAVTLQNLGVNQLARGQRDEARRSFERARDILVDIYGPVHRRVANASFNLFRLHMMNEDVDVAEAHLDSTVAACPSSAPDARRQYERYRAQIDLARGHAAAARDSLRAWREIIDESTSSRQLINVRFLLAQAHLAVGDAEPARVEFERLERYYRERGAHQAHMLAAVDGGFGLCLALEGRHDLARPKVARAAEVYRGLGAADPVYVRRLDAYLASR